MTTANQAIFAIRPAPPPLEPEEQARADFYALISCLLLRPPERSLLDALARSSAFPPPQHEQPLGRAWQGLAAAARTLGHDAILDEFEALFVSIGQPAINPYGSYYLSGFMMEQPLVHLRGDLRSLGLTRVAGAGEPEDHLGALCEAMRLLIAGHAGLKRRPLAEQRTFFLTHIAPWYGRCLDDIRGAEGSDFYQKVANFTQAFFEIEFQALEMGSREDFPGVETEIP